MLAPALEHVAMIGRDDQRSAGTSSCIEQPAKRLDRLKRPPDRDLLATSEPIIDRVHNHAHYARALVHERGLELTARRHVGFVEETLDTNWTQRSLEALR